MARRPISAELAGAAMKRQRLSAGRTETFSTRLTPETKAAIYAEANARNIPIAQVIEEAMAAFKETRR